MSKIVKKEVFSGFGGDLAVEGARGLIKAKTGDTIITLDDGSRHVLAKELMEAEDATVEESVEEPAVLGAGAGLPSLPTDEGGIEKHELPTDEL